MPTTRAKKNDKKKRSPLEILREVLSTDAREAISTRLGKMRPSVDTESIERFLAEIDIILGHFEESVGRRVPPSTARERRRQVQVLAAALRGLHPLTKLDLQWDFGYPMEIIDRLAKGCETFEERARRNRGGAPPDTQRIFFATCIMEAFKFRTRLPVTVAPEGAFEETLGCIMMDATNETNETSETTEDKTGRSYRRLIETAQRELPGHEERLRYHKLHQDSTQRKLDPLHLAIVRQRQAS